jgi:hypothetical protein
VAVNSGQSGIASPGRRRSLGFFLLQAESCSQAESGSRPPDANRWALQGDWSVAISFLQYTCPIGRRLKWIRLKEVDQAQMKRLVIMAIVKICGKAILLAIIAGIVVGVIGHMSKWDTPLAYSNAFFIAGCLMIIAGASSRLGAGQQWKTSQLLYAESFRDMSSSERANFIIEASSSLSLVIVGLLSGILLILVSVFVL